MRITRAPQFRAGYSFTEVMFAVVVLGIGFIMIAAMFPVAIQQSQLTSEETTAAAVAREAVKHITTIADRHTLRPTDNGVVASLPPCARFVGILTPGAPPAPPAAQTIAPVNTGSWNDVKGNLILAADPRYAYVPMYSRSTGSQYARLNIVVVRVRDRSTFDSTDIAPDANANLQPRPISVNITNNVDGSGVDWVEIAGGSIQSVAEGAYIVIASQVASGSTPLNHYAGRGFRIGQPATPVGTMATTPPANTWELSPGNDFTPDLDSTGNPMLLPGSAMPAYVVGRERDPAAPATFRGLAQDVSYYTTYIQVKP